MSAATVLTFEITPGGAGEFRSLAAEYKQYTSGFGATTVFRRVLYATQGFGNVLAINMFSDHTARAEALDRLLGGEADNPLSSLQAPDASARVSSTALAESIDPGEPVITDPPRLLFSYAITATAGNRGRALEAVRSAAERAASLGARPFPWQLQTGGREIIHGVGHDSMVSAEDLMARNRAEPEALPIVQAALEGVLTVGDVRVTSLFDV